MQQACKQCSSHNDSQPLWLGELCQVCWEAYCSKNFWNMFDGLDEEIKASAE